MTDVGEGRISVKLVPRTELGIRRIESISFSKIDFGMRRITRRKKLRRGFVCESIG